MIHNTNGCKHDNDNNIHNKSDERVSRMSDQGPFCRSHSAIPGEVCRRYWILDSGVGND